MTTNERLIEAGCEGAAYFTDAAFESALIGTSEDGRAVYDYEAMVTGIMEMDGMTEEDAREWIDYNTIRSLPYMGEKPPVIVYPLIC